MISIYLFIYFLMDIWVTPVSILLYLYNENDTAGEIQNN